MTPQTLKKSYTAWYAFAIIVIVVAIGGIAYLYSRPGPSSAATAGNVTITIFSGELGPTQYGFGNTSDSIISPGPSFTVKVGTVVTVLFGNAGSMGHNWALVTTRTDASYQLAFAGAQVQSGIDPVPPAGRGSATFTADRPGTFYYICQVPGHVPLGMWGVFTVTP